MEWTDKNISEQLYHVHVFFFDTQIWPLSSTIHPGPIFIWGPKFVEVYAKVSYCSEGSAFEDGRSG